MRKVANTKSTAVLCNEPTACSIVVQCSLDRRLAPGAADATGQGAIRRPAARRP